MEYRFEDEEWRVVDEFPNYAVSNMGRVKNIKTNYFLQLVENGRQIYHKGKKTSKRKSCYLKVSLFNSGYQKAFLVHRLVAGVFIYKSDLQTCYFYNQCLEDI